ncbi:hypothetical protein O3797_06025 [Gemella sanguinis]|jgi:hypothetical protein|uniref:hypothetical protein n=1 Tax=Gemella sanguinis TaxID=84135 RepID=UPI0008075FA9|nr:hypothetical protein [Gemella sanguinis]
METNITDKQNADLSTKVYDVASNKVKVGEPVDEGQFKVLTIENNQNNGMQAMVVAPVDSNKKVEIL